MRTSGAEIPVVRDLILIGGGHAHVHVLKAIGMKPIPGVQVTLVTRDVDTPYSGMLPGHVAGHYTREECHIDLQRLARFASARVVHASAMGLDLGRRTVQCNDGRPPLPYDCISLDIGSTPRFLPGRDPAELQHVTPVKPIDGFGARWDGMVRRILSVAASNAATAAAASATAAASNGAPARPARLVVVGGGAAGVELTLSMQHRLREALRAAGWRDPAAALHVSIIHRGGAVLESHGPRMRAIFERVLQERSIEVLANREAVAVMEGDGSSAVGDENGNGAVLRENGRKAAESGRKGSAGGEGGGGGASDGSTGGSGGGSGGGGVIECSDGSRVPFDEAVWCTHSGAAPWLRETGLRLDDGGFILVDTHLQAVGMPCVFAAGDCCHIDGHARPKAGVFAVRAGPPLADNLRAFLEARPLREYLPQKKFLGIVATGDKYAVASKGAVAFAGPQVWRWKDYIDRTWMAGYQQLPDPPIAPGGGGGVAGNLRGDGAMCINGGGAKMAAAVAAAGPDGIAAVEAAAMRCGGCGSKVGAAVLGRVLSRLRQRLGGDNAGGYGQLGGDDAAVVPLPIPSDMASGGGAAGHQNRETPIVAADAAGAEAAAAAALGRLRLVHTVDYFRSFVSDPFVFGAIAARHALSDVHAMGARPTTALAIAVVPYAGARQVESCLEQAMAGAVRVLDEEGCALVGGHSAEGQELALGFAINGVVDVAAVTGKGGALRPGDRLVLTKAVGTGAVLAADARGKAAGGWVAAAVTSMLAPAAPAAVVLRAHGARACTDVTGFGLIGHLVEMLRASSDASASGDGAGAADAGANDELGGRGCDADAGGAADGGRSGGGGGGGSGGRRKTWRRPGLGAQLDLDALPVLPGALEAAGAGMLSSLHIENIRAALVIADAAAAGDHPLWPLLFDPQTAGPLLAAVPAATADGCVRELRRTAGCPEAVVIGEVVALPAEGEWSRDGSVGGGEDGDGAEEAREQADGATSFAEPATDNEDANMPAVAIWCLPKD